MRYAKRKAGLRNPDFLTHPSIVGSLGVYPHCDTCGNLPPYGGFVFGACPFVSQKWIPFPTALHPSICLEAKRRGRGVPASDASRFSQMGSTGFCSTLIMSMCVPTDFSDFPARVEMSIGFSLALTYQCPVPSKFAKSTPVGRDWRWKSPTTACCWQGFVMGQFDLSVGLRLRFGRV